MRLPRWIVWWRKAAPVRAPSCAHCGQSLNMCPACHGNWAQSGCRVCGIGSVCPIHQAHWV
jgi:hypothetical protein